MIKYGETAMNDKELCAKFRQYPELRKRFEQLAAIIDNKNGETTLANDAEQSIIDELRQMGKDALQSWADCQADRTSSRIKKQKPSAQKHGKKKSDGIVATEK